MRCRREPPQSHSVQSRPQGDLARHRGKHSDHRIPIDDGVFRECTKLFPPVTKTMQESEHSCFPSRRPSNLILVHPYDLLSVRTKTDSREASDNCRAQMPGFAMFEFLNSASTSTFFPRPCILFRYAGLEEASKSAARGDAWILLRARRVSVVVRARRSGEGASPPPVTPRRSW